MIFTMICTNNDMIAGHNLLSVTPFWAQEAKFRANELLTKKERKKKKNHITCKPER